MNAETSARPEASSATNGQDAGSRAAAGLPSMPPSGLSRANITGLATVTLATAAMLGMFGRVVQLQTSPPQRLLETVGTRVSVRPEEPIRGDIMDRRGRVLSTTRFGYRLVADPTLLERERLAEFRKGKYSLDQIIVELSTAAGLKPGELGRTLSEAMRENDERRRLLAEAGKAEADAEEDPTPALPEYATPLEGGAPVELAPALATSRLTEEELSAEVRLKRPLRYLPLTGVLTDGQAAAVRAQGFPGVTLERVPVREYPGGATVAPLVGRLGMDANGTVGLEKTLGAGLTGKAGRVRYVRDAAGRPLWIAPGDVTPAVHGADLRLSIDLEIQRIAQEELFRGVSEYESAGGRCVVVDPSTGEVLAMVDIIRPVPEAVDYPFAPVGSKASAGAPEYVPDRRYKVIKEDKGRLIHPALGHNRCVESVYEPGSTFKSFVWSTITELGRMHPSDVVDTENGYWITSYGREIRDVKARASQTWTDVLINSSNIGMGKGAEKLSFGQLRDAVRRFGFGQKTGIGLPGEATGLVTNLSNWKITSQHSVAFGNEVAVTPLQMVRAYSAFARQGDMAGTIPQLKILAGDAEADRGDVVYRVLPPRVAMLTRDAMMHVAENMETSLATSSHEEKSWRYAMFGKSGTSKIPVGKPPEGMRLPHGVKGYIDKQYYSSFLSGAPTENPRLVTLVIIDDPSPKLTHTNRAYGALTAGPVNRRIMERALTYLGVPPSPGHEGEGPVKAVKPSAPAEEIIPPSDPPEEPAEEGAEEGMLEAGAGEDGR